MSYTLEDYRKESVRASLSLLTPEERANALNLLPAQERVNTLSLLPAQERIAGLAAEELIVALSAEERKRLAKLLLK